MTFSAILVFLKSLWSNVIVRYILIAVVIIVIGVIFYNKQTDKAYQNGIAYQTTVYEKEQQALKEEYEKKLDVANAERESLNLELQKQKTDYATLKAQRENKATTTTKEVIKYVQSPDASKQCLDPNWLRIYQDSLPE